MAFLRSEFSASAWGLLLNMLLDDEDPF